MTDESWYIVRNTRGVTGFVGPGSKPVPLTAAELRPFGIAVAGEEEMAETGRSKVVTVDFEEGDTVRVLSGPWEGTEGVVSKIDFGKRSVTVILEVFDRDTPVELDFDAVRRV